MVVQVISLRVGRRLFRMHYEQHPGPVLVVRTIDSEPIEVSETRPAPLERRGDPKWRIAARL